MGMGRSPLLPRLKQYFDLPKKILQGLGVSRTDHPKYRIRYNHLHTLGLIVWDLDLKMKTL